MATGSRGTPIRVFLLPGMLGTIADDWKPHFDAIHDAGIEAIGIDWPGHGSDKSTPSEFSLQSLVDHVLSKIDEVTDAPVIIWGYSLGGYVALELERQLPGRVEAIWMHATKFYWNEEEIESFHKSFEIDTMSPRRQETMQKLHSDGWQQLVNMNLELFDDIADNGLTDEDLEEIRCPVLITVGDQDELVTTSEMEQLADALIVGEPKIFTGVRHPLHSTRSSLLIPFAAEFSRRVHK